MSPAPFKFTLELSGQGVSAPLLEQLAGQVIRHVGASSVPMEQLRGALAQATADGTFGGARRCDVQLRAHNQKLEILVSANGGRLWQTSCDIP